MNHQYKRLDNIFYAYRFNAADPVIASQRRSVGVAIRPPEALPITEMLVVRRKNGLPHQ